MMITDRHDDPVAVLRMVDGYMRWALEATRQVIGDDQLAYVLQKAGLSPFINNYPAGDLSVSGEVTYGDYANLSAGLINIYGLTGKNLVLRIGQESAARAFDFQRTIFNMATLTAAQLLPLETRLKMGLSALMAGFKMMARQAGQSFIGSVEDQGDYFTFTLETCPVCAGKQASSPICWLMEATLEEAAQRAFGQFFDVVEVECRAKGDPACVFHFPKTPSDPSVNRSAGYGLHTTSSEDRLHITDRVDPATALHTIDAYIRWALLASEEVVGKTNLAIVLREAGLERLIDHYPPDNPTVSGNFTFRDYASLNTSLIEFFGRGANSITRNIGRLSMRQGMQSQFEEFNLSGLISSQLLPVEEQMKLGMETIHTGFRVLLGAVGDQWEGRVEDQPDGLAFVVDTCPLCAGKRANGCLGGVFEGLLEEGAHWLTGQRVEVRETECKAQGAACGVWKVRPRTE